MSILVMQFRRGDGYTRAVASNVANVPGVAGLRPIAGTLSLATATCSREIEAVVTGRSM